MKLLIPIYSSNYKEIQIIQEKIIQRKDFIRSEPTGEVNDMNKAFNTKLV